MNVASCTAMNVVARIRQAIQSTRAGAADLAGTRSRPAPNVMFPA